MIAIDEDLNVDSRLSNIVRHFRAHALRGASTGFDLSFATSMPDRRGLRALAEWFENQPTEGDRSSYSAFKADLAAQMRMALSLDYSVTLVEEDPFGGAEPMVRHARTTRHLPVLSSSTGDFPEDHPLLEQSPFVDSTGNQMCYNDLFRFVHDLFGHVHLGASTAPFNTEGEWRAWRMHEQMFHEEARGALAAEALSQIAWMSAAPRFDGDPRAVSDRPFPPQKVLNVPEKFLILLR